MPDQNIDNRLIYALLQQVQADQQLIRQDIGEIKDRLTLMDGTLRSIHSEIANLYGLYAHQGGRIDRLEARVDRIERRLELSEGPPS